VFAKEFVRHFQQTFDIVPVANEKNLQLTAVFLENH
jgi:hypothetical protein